MLQSDERKETSSAAVLHPTLSNADRCCQIATSSRRRSTSPHPSPPTAPGSSSSPTAPPSGPTPRSPVATPRAAPTLVARMGASTSRTRRLSCWTTGRWCWPTRGLRAGRGAPASPSRRTGSEPQTSPTPILPWLALTAPLRGRGPYTRLTLPFPGSTSKSPFKSGKNYSIVGCGEDPFIYKGKTDARAGCFCVAVGF